MALSTLRLASRGPWSALYQSSVIARSSAPMATSAHEEMKKFWAKNAKLNRPSSPWIIYLPHLPMMTSLTHRTTGIIMGVALYGISLGLLVKSGDVTSYIEMVKNAQLSPALLFTGKTLMAFPLIYHYINGIRHLTWDAGHGFEMKTQYKSGWAIITSACLLSLLAGGISYLG